MRAIPTVAALAAAIAVLGIDHRALDHAARAGWSEAPRAAESSVSSLQSPAEEAEDSAGGAAPAEDWRLETENSEGGALPEELPDELAPEPEAPVAPHEPATARLIALARDTWVFSEPRWKSRKLGYLRVGNAVAADPEPVTRQSCRGGWHRVEPRGFVCTGWRATFDAEHSLRKLAGKAPDKSGLPYLYVQTRYPTPPLYGRLPSVDEQERAETARQYYLRQHERLRRQPDFVEPPPADALPALLGDGAPLPALGGEVRGGGPVLGQARIRSGFALLASYEHEGRRFGLTTELALIPLDRTRVVRQSPFHGLSLSDELTLPIAFVRAKHARRWTLLEAGQNFAAGEPLPWRAAFGLTGVEREKRGETFFEAVDGSWLRARDVGRVDRFVNEPRWAARGTKWIDVSILRQSLVAYEGTRPVYATLVSTGKDGIEDHRDSHATIQGTFLIHTKHVSVTMDGSERGDEFDLRDVPFVQYFTRGGYALHGAYWHDDFGTPRSHGCINLAPVDAAWLFGWTSPEVPEGWHATLSPRQGTLVNIHP